MPYVRTCSIVAPAEMAAGVLEGALEAPDEPSLIREEKGYHHCEASCLGGSRLDGPVDRGEDREDQKYHEVHKGVGLQDV